MFAHAFRFDHAQFQSRVRHAFEPRKPRHPLVRIAFGLVGLALLVVMVVFGVVVGTATRRMRTAAELLVARRAAAREQRGLEHELVDEPPQRMVVALEHRGIVLDVVRAVASVEGLKDWRIVMTLRDTGIVVNSVSREGRFARTPRSDPSAGPG